MTYISICHLQNQHGGLGSFWLLVFSITHNSVRILNCDINGNGILVLEMRQRFSPLV